MPHVGLPSGATHIIGVNWVLVAETENDAEQLMFVPSTEKEKLCWPAVHEKSRDLLPLGPNEKLPTLTPSIDTSIVPGGFQGCVVARILQESWDAS
jgi:hypothetical protein